MISRIFCYSFFDDIILLFELFSDKFNFEYNFVIFIFILECRIFLKKINLERFFHAELNGDHKAEDDDENNETTTAVNNQKSPNSQNFDKKELQPEPNITPTLTSANSVVESAAAPKEKTIEIEENNKNEVPENSVKTHENSCVNNDKEMDTDEDDKPLARRRRSLIKVVQPTVSSQN